MKPQSETIRYFVQYQDGKVLGFELGEYAPASRWYEGQSFETSEEANRWAAERSKNKLWRLIQVDLEVDADPSLTRFVTPEEADFWHAQQEQLWSDDVVFNPGVRDFLAKLGADEAVIEFIEASAPENQGKLANIVRKTPQITVDELEKWSEENLKTKREPDNSERLFAQIFAENCTATMEDAEKTPEYVAAFKWMLVHLMKLRTGKVLSVVAGGHQHEHKWNDSDDYGDRFLTFYTPRGDIIFSNVFLHQVSDWVSNTAPELYSYDLYTARAASDEWHAQCKLAGSGENYEKTHPANIIAKLSNGWTIQYISSEHDLEVEGNRMGHCAASYWDSVRTHQSQIYSLRDLKNEPHVTIEFGVYPSMKTRMVRQIQGKGNAEPIAEYKELIREWLLTIPDVQWERGGSGWRLDDYGLDEAARKIDELITDDGRDEYGIIVGKPDFSEVYAQAYRLAEEYMNRGRHSRGWSGHGITDALAEYAVVYDKENPNEVEKFLEEKEQEGQEQTNGWDYYDGFDEEYFKRGEPEPDPDEYEKGEEDEEFIADTEKWEEKLQTARDLFEQESRDEEIKTFLPYAFPAEVFSEFYAIKGRQLISEKKKK